MSFLNNMINELTHNKSHSQSQGQNQNYPQQQSYNGPPQPPAPWIAEWDQYENRWMYINRQTGQRTHELPQQYNSGYDDRGYGQQGTYPPQGYGQPAQTQQNSHGGRNMALGGLAGAAGGALLMHEGEKVEERWDEDKYRADYDINRAENYADRKFYDGVQDVEDFPQDAARWTGEKVQDVEDIPGDIERRWDGFEQDVEDVPGDIAGGVGDMVGDVERFGDGMGDAYDAGRDEERYDDGGRGDGW